MHAVSRHGTPSLTSLLKDDEVSCEVRPPRSPIPNLTSLDQAELQSPDEDCISHSASHPVNSIVSLLAWCDFMLRHRGMLFMHNKDK